MIQLKYSFLLKLLDTFQFKLDTRPPREWIFGFPWNLGRGPCMCYIHISPKRVVAGESPRCRLQVACADEALDAVQNVTSSGIFRRQHSGRVLASQESGRRFGAGIFAFYEISLGTPLILISNTLLNKRLVATIIYLFFELFEGQILILT